MIEIDGFVYLVGVHPTLIRKFLHFFTNIQVVHTLSTPIEISRIGDSVTMEGTFEQTAIVGVDTLEGIGGKLVIMVKRSIVLNFEIHFWYLKRAA